MEQSEEEKFIEEILKECDETEKNFVKSNMKKVIKICNLTRIHIFNSIHKF